MPAPAWHALLVRGSPRRYTRGEALLRQGEPGRFVLALTSGLAKVTRLDADGHEVVLAVRGRGEIVGEITYLDNRVRLATVTATTACLAYIVPDGSFRQIIADFDLNDLVFRHVSGRLRESEEIRSELASLPPRRRIARMLLRLSPDGYCGLSQADFAKAVGLSRSAVAGELAWFRERRMVVTGRQRVTITDCSRLVAFADGRVGL